MKPNHLQERATFDRKEIDEAYLTDFYRRKKADYPWRSRDAYLEDPLHRKRFRAIHATLKTLHPQTILDAGCGAGALWAGEEAKALNARIVGVDLSPVSAGETPLAPVCGKLQRLPFSNESFDVVVCSETLEHLLDVEPAMGELARVLQPGGHLVVTVPNLFCLDSLEGSTGAVSFALSAVNRARKWAGRPPAAPFGVNTHLQKMWPAAWKKKLERCDLKIEKSAPIFLSPYVPYSAEALKRMEQKAYRNGVFSGIQSAMESVFSSLWPFSVMGQIHLFVFRKAGR